MFIYSRQSHSPKYSNILACFNEATRLFWLFRSILKMFNEIHCWELLKFEVPHFVSLICERREDLYTLRENVLLLVKEYNRSE